MLLKYAEIRGEGGCQLARGEIPWVLIYVCFEHVLLPWLLGTLQIFRGWFLRNIDSLACVYVHIELLRENFMFFLGWFIFFFYVCTLHSPSFAKNPASSQTITSLLFRFSRWLKRTLEVFKRYGGGVFEQKK